MSRSVVAEMSSWLWSIYCCKYLFHAGSGPLICNFSVHCFVVIHVGVWIINKRYCQRFLNPSRMCQCNRFTNFCQRLLNWNKSRVWARCYFPFPVVILSRFVHITYYRILGSETKGPHHTHSLTWLNTVLVVCDYMSFAKSWQEKGFWSQAETWQVKNVLMKDFDWRFPSFHGNMND